MSVDRDLELNHLRADLVAATMELIAAQYREPMTFHGREKDVFDTAALALADKLREPETCYACGQDNPA